jgi:hypothetical protein
MEIPNSVYENLESDLSFGSPESTSGFTSVYNWIGNINMFTWVLIFITLSILGINIFGYLQKGSDEVSGFINPILNFIKKVSAQIVNVSAEGGKGVADVGVIATKEVAQVGVGVVEKGGELTKNTLSMVQNTTSNDFMPQTRTATGQEQNALDLALGNSTNNSPLVSAVNAESSITDDIRSEGWCYIGTDRTYRTCAQVGINDKCMSGDIFPSRDICVNPRLRT